MKIEPNARVVLDYSLRTAAGPDAPVLDASESEGGAPMVFVHGYGMIVPGLEKAILGLAPGDRRSVVVPPEAGYGERDEELVLEVDRQEMPRPDAVAVGDELVAENADGEEAVMHVTRVEDDSVTLDGNHPLAGETLHYEIAVREVRAATEKEIAEAAGAFEAAGYEPPAPSSPNLVQLGRSPRKTAKRGRR